MELLCSTGAFCRFPDYTHHESVLTYGPQLAVDGFELMFYPGWYEKLEQVARDLRSSGLCFPALHCEKSIATSLGHHDATVREEGRRLFSQNCFLAGVLGVKVLILHLWGLPELDDHLAVNLQSLSACLNVASRHGLALAIETIPGRHFDPLYNVYTAIECDPRAVIALDTEFLAQYEQLDTIFATDWLWHSQRTRHVHIKDFDGHAFTPNGQRRYLHPGEGHINFTRFIDLLKQKGFQGPLSLESSAIDDDGHAHIDKLQRSLAFLRTLLA